MNNNITDIVFGNKSGLFKRAHLNQNKFLDKKDICDFLCKTLSYSIALHKKNAMFNSDTYKLPLPNDRLTAIPL